MPTDDRRVIVHLDHVPAWASFNDRQAIKARALRAMRDMARAEGYSGLIDVRVRVTPAPLTPESNDDFASVMRVEARAVRYFWTLTP